MYRLSSCGLLLLAATSVALNSIDISLLSAQERNANRIKPYAKNPRYWQHKGQPVMLLGTLVDVEIQGEIIESVIPLQREWLRDGTKVWVFSEDETLKIQEVTTSFRGFEQVCVVEGLEDGDRVVLTDIAAPVEGMPLVLLDEATSESNQPGPQEGEGA